MQHFVQTVASLLTPNISDGFENTLGLLENFFHFFVTFFEMPISCGFPAKKIFYTLYSGIFFYQNIPEQFIIF